MSNTYRPGQEAPKSGQYQIVGPKGGTSSYGEVTAIEGKPLPPTEKPNMGYKLVDPTKHKS